MAASAPYSNPHLLRVNSGSPCGASLLSRKNLHFMRHPRIDGKFVKKYMKLFFVLFFTAILAGCGSAEQSSGIDEKTSATLQPADSVLAEIYNRSCKSCHTIAATGAPLTGDSVAWQSRLELGVDAMVNSVINGSGGMPPFGLCMDCEPEQFEALIVFMASGVKP